MIGRLINRVVEYQASKAPTSDELKKQILHNPQSVIKARFPYPAGDVYFIRPEEAHEQELSTLINTLDAEDEGRKPYQGLDYLTNGPSIVTLGGVAGKTLHHRISQSLTRPADYIGAVLKIQDEFFHHKSILDAGEMTKWPLIHTISYALLGTTEINANLVDAIQSYDVLEKGSTDLSKKVFFQLLGTKHKDGMKHLPGGEAARDAYKLASEKILFDLLPTVREQLKQYINGQMNPNNIVTLSIISMLQEELKKRGVGEGLLAETVKKMLTDFVEDDQFLIDMFKNRYLLTLPAVVQPGTNIAKICQCALLQLGADDELHQNLKKYLTDNGIDKNSSQEDLKKFFENDDRHDGLLNAIYLESLRLGGPQHEVNDNTPFDFFTWRYSVNKITYAGCEIPAKSVIAIADALPRFDEKKYPNPYKFNVYRFCIAPQAEQNKLDALKRFGTFARHCPAKKISQYLAKAYIVGLVTKYNFELNEKNQVHLMRR